MYFYKTAEYLYAKLYRKEIKNLIPVYDENGNTKLDENGKIITEEHIDSVYGWVFEPKQPEKNYVKIRTMRKKDELEIMQMTAKYASPQMINSNKKKKDEEITLTTEDIRNNADFIEESDKWFSEKCDFTEFPVTLSLELSQTLFQLWQENSKLTEKELDFLA